MTRALIGASALLLAGCSMTPAYERPAPPVPATLPQGEAYAAPAAGETAGLAWTELVQDARLRTVIERALANNRDLRAAIANVQSARAGRDYWRVRARSRSCLLYTSPSPRDRG